jgi:hypothetical protein
LDVAIPLGAPGLKNQDKEKSGRAAEILPETLF